MTSADILVVDDEQSVRNILTILMEREGHKVIAASDGYEAVNHIESTPFDVAILDINIPGPSGIDLLKKIKASKAETEVIVVSGYASVDTAVEAVRAGAYDYIIKPFNIQTLCNVVRQGLEKQRQATETKQHLAQLEEKNRELGMLYELRGAIGYTLDYDELMALIMSSLHNVLNYSASAFLFFDEKIPGLTIWINPETPKSVIDQVKSSLIDAFNSISDTIISEDKISAKLRKKEYISLADKNSSTILKSFLNIPLVSRDKEENRLIGMVNISSYDHNAFDQGTSKLFHSIANDIISDTLEKQKKVLGKEKNRLEMMLESMTDGVIMLDQERHITIMNPAARRMFGLNGENVKSEDIIDRIPNTKLSGAMDLFICKEEFVQEEKCSRFEEDIHIEDTGIFVSANVSPLISDDEMPHGIVAVFHDITKRKEIEEAKFGFISTASHELRTPLTSIQNAITIIEMSGELNEQQRKFFDTAIRNIDRLTRVTNELLDFSRLESGKMQMSFDSVDLKALAVDSIRNLLSLAANKSVEIIENMPDDLPKAYADYIKMDQVFTNIIDNAIKYTPENGKITVSASVASEPSDDDEKFIEVRISDTGIGISPEDQERIFDKFERATLYNKGVGLGLAIVKKIIDNHNGKISVESELGKGSSFIFTIPVAR